MGTQSVMSVNDSTQGRAIIDTGVSHEEYALETASG